MSRFVVVLIVGLCAGLLALGVQASDRVDAKCNPNRVDDRMTYFSGWWRHPGGTVGGVYADIWNYDPWVAPGPYFADVSIAWSMVDNPYIGNGRWAQVGWMERAYDLRYTFVQWHNPSGVLITNAQWAPQPENTYSRYMVLYNNTPGKFTFFVNGQTIAIADAGWVPNEGQLFGETKTRASQMAGGYNNHEVFKESFIWYNNGFYAFNGISDATDPVIHGHQIQSGWVHHIWDKACPT